MQNLPALLKPQPRKKPLTSGASPIRGLWSAVNDSETITERNFVIKVGTKFVRFITGVTLSSYGSSDRIQSTHDTELDMQKKKD